MFLDPFHQTQSSGLPQVCSRAALDEPVGRLPLTKCYGVGKRCAISDDGAWRFDVCSVIEKRV